MTKQYHANILKFRQRPRLALFMLPLLAGLFCVMTQSNSMAGDLQRYTFQETAMSIPVRMIICAENEAAAKTAAEAAFRRAQEMSDRMTDYDSASELMRLCREGGKTGKPVPVSDDLFRVLKKAKQISTDSQGAFDITVGPIVRLWRRARRLHEFPEKRLLEDARALVGNDLWEIDEKSQTVTLKKDKMLFDLGGIAKGDIIDQAVATLKQQGITAALVDAGGDIRVYGIPPANDAEAVSGDANGWVLGVSAHNKEIGRVVTDGIALASSGDLSRYALIDGVKYSHIVDPKTGLGLTNQTAVTVFAPDAITADALASALSVLPPEQGLQLLDNDEGAAAMISRRLPEESTDETERPESTAVWYSKNWGQLVSDTK